MLDIILIWDQTSVKQFFVKTHPACLSCRNGSAGWLGETGLGGQVRGKSPSPLSTGAKGVEQIGLYSHCLPRELLAVCRDCFFSWKVALTRLDSAL